MASSSCPDSSIFLDQGSEWRGERWAAWIGEGPRGKAGLCPHSNTSLLRKAADHHHIHHIQTQGLFQTEIFPKFVKAAQVSPKHQDSQTTGNISYSEVKFFHPGTSVCLYLWVCYVMCVLVCYLNHNSASCVLPGWVVVVQSLSHVRLFATPMDCPSPSPGVCSNSCPLSRWCHPTISSSVVAFSSCLQSFPASGSFPVSRLFASSGQSIYWSFSVSPSNEYSGLISFRINWFDLLAVQRTLNSLLQHHSLKASILWCSALFMAQLSHPYVTTGNL